MKIISHNKGMQLNKTQLAPLDEACPFCLSSNRLCIGLLQENPKIELLLCQSCHAVSASRIPNAQALEEYYKDFYLTPFSKHAKKITFDLPDKLASHIFNLSSEYFDNNHIKVIDFGGGDGTISIEVAKKLLEVGYQKVDVQVIDYNYIELPCGDKRINLSYDSELSNLKNDNYDLVIASASIEHVPEPRKIMIKLLSLLQNGGIFYARTPYMVPFFKLFALFGIHLDLTYPAHIHDLGPDFWNRIFKKLYPETHFEILASHPSIVETSFKDHFLITMAAYIFKGPWYLLKKRYNLVGGWEVFVRKNENL